MNPWKRAKKEIALQMSKFIWIKVKNGPCAGMRLYGDLFYNRRSKWMTTEELLYDSLDLENKVLIDVGANIGLHTILFGGKNRFGKVLAFEPNPIPFLFLCKNIMKNSLANVIPVNAGLSNQDENLCLVFPRYNTSKGSCRQEKQIGLVENGRSTVRIDVPVTTLDRAVREYGLERVDFVKIDVEGLEPEVIEGMPSTLRDLKPIVCFEIHGSRKQDRVHDLTRIVTFMSCYGYRLVKLSNGIPQVTCDNVARFDGGGYVGFFKLTPDLKSALNRSIR